MYVSRHQTPGLPPVWSCLISYLPSPASGSVQSRACQAFLRNPACFLSPGGWDRDSRAVECHFQKSLLPLQPSLWENMRKQNSRLPFIFLLYVLLN